MYLPKEAEIKNSGSKTGACGVYNIVGFAVGEAYV